MQGPGARPAARGHRLDPRRPHQRRRRRRHRQGHPRAAGARPQRRRAWPRWPSPCCSRSTAASCAADRDVRAGEIYRDGTIPYQRFRAWQLAGQTVGHRRARRGRPGRRVALRGPRHEGHLLRPVRPRRHPLARRPARRGRRRVDARRGHARDARDDRRRAVRPHEGGRGLRQLRPAPACTTPTRSPQSLPSGHLGGAGLDHFDGERLDVDHPLCAMDERRAHAAHRRRHLRHRGEPHDADRRRPRTPARRRHPPNLSTRRSSSERRARGQRRRGEAAAARHGQGDADVGAGAGHRRQRLRAPARRQRRAHAVVARLPHDDLDDLVVCNLDGNVVEGTAAPRPRRCSTSRP